MSEFSLTHCFLWTGDLKFGIVGWRKSNEAKDLIHFLSYLFVWVLLLVQLLAGCILSLALGLVDPPFVSFCCMTFFFRVYTHYSRSWRGFYYQDDLFSVHVCLTLLDIRGRLNFLTVAKFCIS